MKAGAFLLLVACFTCRASLTLAESCSATNDLGDTCSVDCPSGQAAECMNGTGAGSPTCKCTGTPEKPSWLFTAKRLDNTIKAHRNVKGDFVDEKVTIEATDARVVINRSLSSLRDYKLSNNCSRVRTGRYCESGCASSNAAQFRPGEGCGPPHCEDVFATRCSLVTGKLTISGALELESQPVVDFKEPNWKDIPQDFLGLKETYTNCSDTAQDITFSHSEKTMIGTTVTKGKTVTTGKEITAEASANFTLAGGGGGAKLGVKFSNTISVSESRTETHQEEKTFTASIPIRVAPMTHVDFAHYFIRREVPLFYSGTVQLNGPLVQNLEGVNSLKDVMQDAKQRTFEFSGVVVDVSMYEGQTDNIARKLTLADCQSSKSLTRTVEFLDK